jgi:hypothetical protein
LSSTPCRRRTAARAGSRRARRRGRSCSALGELLPPGRIRSEAAFAAFAGISALVASRWQATQAARHDLDSVEPVCILRQPHECPRKQPDLAAVRGEP